MSDKIETIQYNAASAITGAIRGPFKEEFHQDLVLKFLDDRRWLKPMSKLCEIVLSKLPPSFYEIIPPLQMSLGTLIVFKLYVVGNDLLPVIFYGDKKFDNKTSFKIITATTKFTEDTQCSEKYLF